MPITHYNNFFTQGAFCGAQATDYAMRPTCPACVEGLLALTEQLVRCDAATLDTLNLVGSNDERDRAAGNLFASQQSAAAWRELLTALRQQAA